MTESIGHRLPQIEIPNFDPILAMRNDFKDLMAEDIELSKRERKNIASDMPIDQGLLSRWLSHGHHDCMPAHWLVRWTRAVSPRLLAWIAREAGFQLVAVETETPKPSGNLLPLIARHQGELMAQILQARADGEVDETERENVYPIIDRLIRELEAESENWRPARMRRSA